MNPSSPVAICSCPRSGQSSDVRRVAIGAHAAGDEAALRRVQPEFAVHVIRLAPSA